MGSVTLSAWVFVSAVMQGATRGSRESSQTQVICYCHRALQKVTRAWSFLSRVYSEGSVSSHLPIICAGGDPITKLNGNEQWNWSWLPQEIWGYCSLCPPHISWFCGTMFSLLSDQGFGHPWSKVKKLNTVTSLDKVPCILRLISPISNRFSCKKKKTNNCHLTVNRHFSANWLFTEFSPRHLRRFSFCTFTR